MFKTMLADIGLDVVFVPEDGAVTGMKVDMEKFLKLKDVVRSLNFRKLENRLVKYFHT